MISIKEAAAQTGLSADTIRYYEKLGLLPEVRRSSTGIRQFDDAVLSRLAFIKKMRQAGMSLASLQKYINLYQSPTDTTQEQYQLLKEQKQIMEVKKQALQAAIDHLDFKIQHFSDHVLPAEDKLHRLEAERMVKITKK